jgi:nitrogen fixation NifU-like protein
MSDLEELYQELILDHYRTPRNFGALPDANRVAHGDNPLCGDKVAVTLRLEDGKIADLRFKGSGCAISTASASLMTEAVKGRTPGEAQALFERFHRLVTGTANGSAGPAADLGKLEVFAGVSEFPVRVKCASLAWHTLKAALEGSRETVSTE